MASPDTIILYCGSKNEKFLTHSILGEVGSLTVWWCCLMFFLVYETKFTVGKWQLRDGLHYREEERSMGDSRFDTWGIPLSSAVLRPHGPWRIVEIRDPDLTWNLSFIFIYDFWKYKSRKNLKRIGIFQIELTPKEFFGTEIDENEIRYCMSLEQTFKTVFSCYFCRGQLGQAIKLFQPSGASKN